MKRFRGFILWISDWRTGATFAGTLLVILLGVVVIDGRQARDHALQGVTAQANQARSSQEAATRRIDLLTGEIQNLRTELDAVLSATTDEGRQKAVADAEQRRTSPTTTTTTTPPLAVPANRPASASPGPSPAPEPPSTTTTTQPPPPTTAPCTTMPIVGTCVPGRASRSSSAPRCGGWYDLVASYDWQTDTACRILICESGGDPDAQNRSGANGLMQIMGGPLDPEENMALAYQMWTQRGWQPWVCK